MRGILRFIGEAYLAAGRWLVGWLRGDQYAKSDDEHSTP